MDIKKEEHSERKRKCLGRKREKEKEEAKNEYLKFIDVHNIVLSDFSVF